MHYISLLNYIKGFRNDLAKETLALMTKIDDEDVLTLLGNVFLNVSFSKSIFLKKLL